MLYSLGYGTTKLYLQSVRSCINETHDIIGAVNFVFGLPAIRTIDTLGRRKWLTLTLPIMSLLMMAAALSTLIDRGNNESNVRTGVVALFIFCKSCFPKSNAVNFANM